MKISENINRIKRKKKDPLLSQRTVHMISMSVALFAGLIIFLFIRSLAGLFISIIAFFLLVEFYFIIRAKLKRTADVRKMEDSFPDFIELMASNLRAGMTIDKALILSSRKEFAPLD